ncbi:MAG: hypothetical protein ACE5HB_01040 [Terriglobia bacterium]
MSFRVPLCGTRNPVFDRFRLALLLPALGLLCLFVLGGMAGFAAEAQKGRLRILVNDEQVGTETYEIAGTVTEVHARGQVTLGSGEHSLRHTTDLMLGADYAPRTYEWRMEQPHQAWLRISFRGSKAVVRFPREDGQEEEQIFDFAGPRVAVLDNNVFHHYLLLTRLYDFQKGGAQTIPVFVPQSVQPGAVTVELVGVEPREVGGESVPVRQLSIRTEDNQLLLWVTEDGRFVELRVPRANVTVLPDDAD